MDTGRRDKDKKGAQVSPLHPPDAAVKLWAGKASFIFFVCTHWIENPVDFVFTVLLVPAI